MATPHKCPVCNGTGLVSIPPNVAGDGNPWADTGTGNPWADTGTGSGPYPCKACNGLGIVWEYYPVYVPSVWPVNPQEYGDPPEVKPPVIYYGDPPDRFGTSITITNLDNTTYKNNIVDTEYWIVCGCKDEKLKS